MTYKDDTYTLSTGRTIYANNGILGLSPELQLSEGYDGEIEVDGELTDYGGATALTFEERREIAAEMITRWITWWKRAGADGEK